jgi:hypothetical protein
MDVFDNDLPPTDESLAVQTLDPKTLKPPESRLGPAWAIRNRIFEMRKKDGTRSLRRDKIQRWIDGARPLSTTKLEKTGQADRTNFNPREAESMLEAAVAPYYSLIFRNPQYLSLENSYGTSKQLQTQWSNKIARNAHRMLDEWDEFSYNLKLKLYSMLLFGPGIVMFPDEENWQWQTRKLREFLVPDGIPASTKKLPEACYFREISPVDLYKLVENEEKAKEMGWYPDRVKKAIVKVAGQAITNVAGAGIFGDSWSEAYSASLRRGDSCWNTESAQIRLSGYFDKEFSGKISHCIFIDDPVPTSPRDLEDESLMLFKKVEQFESFEQIVHVFFHDVGTGEWHSVRAQGARIRDLTVANAILFCTMIDGAMKSSVFLLQAQDATSEEVSQMIEIAGANIIPSGLKLEQNRITDQLEGPMNVRREVQNTLQTTSAQYLARVSGENSEPTLGQAQLNFRNQQSLSESEADNYLKGMDRLFRETLRRALAMGIRCFKEHHPEDEPPEEYRDEVPTFPNDAEAGAYWLVRRCVLEDKIPIEALDWKWICNVRATRGAGGGSPAAVDMSTRELITLLPTMDERSRRNALRERVAFLMGHNNVDEYYPPFDEADLPDDNAALATLENNALRQEDGEVLITPLQDHVIHFTYHFSDCAQDLQALQSGQSKRNPVQVLVHLHNAGVHMRGHLNQIAGDETRKDKFEQMDGALIQLSKMTDQLQQQVMESLQSQQEPQGPSPEMVSAVMKTQGELALKKQKQDAEIGMKADKQAATNHIKDVTSAFNMYLKNRESQAQLALAAPAVVPKAA